MNCETEITGLVDTLSGFTPGNTLENYIAYVRFPHFKGLEAYAAISFKFPFTALVGANGIGKSSVLHALWGMPNRYSTAKFWFSTNLDKISAPQKNPQRYIYGHFNKSFKGIVETRKARVGTKADYWEPTKWSSEDGMQKPPKESYERKSIDRWNPVSRSVLYINCKMTFGSFDKYFYLNTDDAEGAKLKRTMRGVATRLKKIVADNSKSFLYRGNEKLKENRMLNKDELNFVSRILGNEYKSARLIRHSLYPHNRGEDLTVIFKRGVEYSEAYAGSGEVSVVSAVVQILAAPKFSLILLDEPETSLHPRAQREFLRFLLDQIKLKHHQIVVSTHSRDFLTSLPDNAIKVFESNGDGKTRIIDGCSPNVALHRLGAVSPNKLRIMVEDELARLLVLEAMLKLDPGDADNLDIKVAPGGAEAMLTHYGPIAMESGDDLFLLLDGDKKKVDKFIDPNDISPNEHSNLEKILQEQIGCNPKFMINGGVDKNGHTKEKTAAYLKYLVWISARVKYLPRQCPEQILLYAMDPKSIDEAKTSKKSKDMLSAKIKFGLKNINSAGMLALQQVEIEKNKEAMKNDLEIISRQLREWLQAKTNPVKSPQ